MAQPKEKGGLGFRSFHAFNTALLAKQWWRLMTVENSLMARVLKACYFRHSPLMEATKGSRPSYTWSSIMGARWVLDKGCLWRVGTGENINIWSHQWVPGAAGFRLFSGHNYRPGLQRVSQLLLPGRREWNHALIRQVFAPHEASLILQIPVSGNALASSSGAISGIWKVLWQTKSIPRCKELLWRACHDIVPVRAVLVNRGIVTDSICPLCGDDDETLVHAFFGCSEVAPVWFSSPLFMDFRHVPDNFSLVQWLSQILKEGDDWLADSVFTLLWAIWERRNKWCFDHQWYPFDFVLRRASSLASVGFTVGDEGSVLHGQRREGGNATWRPPQSGIIKVNVDASVSAGSLMGYGYIARNSRGEVLATAAAKWPTASTVALAEAMALRWALQLSLDLGFFAVDVEIDSKMVVDAWSNHSRQCSYLALVVSDSVFISQSFHSFSLAHVLRASNMAADFLAKFALS
ncbi:uncharacterized protein LOC130717521 [Lotus japonicus]|uniref:uncharacterized protein LOC130717521 n=1 Tax=Lotus japonicus TaxID=34305 RepID=UPI0025835B36|nr:uncharacterized protein LOC130717521 [Lotus japonicus]